ncbi:MAG: hypothetical protein AAB152_06825 [Candidatus Coatesbacteria bacterium]
MISVDGLILCDDAIQDSNSGKRIYYGVFETVSVKELPALVRKMYVCFRTRGTGTHSLRVQVSGPKGKDDGAAWIEGKVVFPEQEGQIDQAVLLSNFVLSYEGRYEVVLMEGESVLGRTSLWCKVKAEER